MAFQPYQFGKSRPGEGTDTSNVPTAEEAFNLDFGYDPGGYLESVAEKGSLNLGKNAILSTVFTGSPAAALERGAQGFVAGMPSAAFGPMSDMMNQVLGVNTSLGRGFSKGLEMFGKVAGPMMLGPVGMVLSPLAEFLGPLFGKAAQEAAQFFGYLEDDQKAILESMYALALGGQESEFGLGLDLDPSVFGEPGYAEGDPYGLMDPYAPGGLSDPFSGIDTPGPLGSGAPGDDFGGGF
jgi:hypothetical protein